MSDWLLVFTPPFIHAALPSNSTVFSLHYFPPCPSSPFPPNCLVDLSLSLSLPFTNMSEFSSKKKNIDHLSSLLLSDFILFCSFIFSHPLYFSYLIFFSPYLFKIFSFLSPLFITTSLLLLSLFTLLLHDTSPLEKFSESNVSSLLLTTYQNLVERFKSNVDDEFQCFFALQVYEIVFENPDEESSLQFQPSEAFSDQFPETENAEVKSFREFLEEKQVFEDFPQTEGEKEVNSGKSGEQKEEQPIIAKESKEEMKSIKISEEKVGIDNSKAMLNSSERERGDNYEDAMGPVNLGSFGSMRREKEWTRTLACKLFEERHTADVGGDSALEEGMDLLWETYEADTNKGRVKSGSKKGNKHGYDEENLDEEFEPNGQFCCLQALKLSAGKMHLGMRTPNLMKISKALKGIGWLHQVSSRHGKKKGYR